MFVGHAAAASPGRNAPTSWAWRRPGCVKAPALIIADVPIDTPNARGSGVVPEIQSVLMAGGVPSRAITLRHYRPGRSPYAADDQAQLSEDCGGGGPCGLWPQDLGPNIDNAAYNENRSYHNFGCATQRNLAAMIDNPADLEQPRPREPRLYAAAQCRLRKYRKGTPTTTTYPEADKAKLSDTGK